MIKLIHLSKLNKYYLPLFIGLTFFIFSCNKGPDFSIIPRIEFESIKVLKSSRGKDTLAKISFKVFDGDGDLGNPLSTNTTRDNKDIFLTKFRKINKLFIEIKLDTIPPYDEPNTVHIPYLFSLPPGITPSGKNKQIEAIVDVIDFFVQDPTFLQNDTIKYKIIIKDRKEHYSNEIETSEVVVRK